jgi:hypothetical protein
MAGIGNMVEWAEDGESYTFHYDHRGAVFGVTDGAQEVAQTYEHDGWGAPFSSSPPGTAQGPGMCQGRVAISGMLDVGSRLRQPRPW